MVDALLNCGLIKGMPSLRMGFGGENYIYFFLSRTNFRVNNNIAVNINKSQNKSCSLLKLVGCLRIFFFFLILGFRRPW